MRRSSRRAIVSLTSARAGPGDLSVGISACRMPTVEGPIAPGIDLQNFLVAVDVAKVSCPLSKALASTPITLWAKLV
jgi:hypothetical protein